MEAVQAQPWVPWMEAWWRVGRQKEAAELTMAVALAEVEATVLVVYTCVRCDALEEERASIAECILLSL